MAEELVVGVALDVRLVDDVQAELVAQVEEPGVVRVVGAAHRVDVGPLHGHQVGAHVVDGDGLAPIGVVVVAVDALDRHGAPVDQQLAVPHLDPPEAGDLADHLDHLAVRVPERDQDGVAVGLLGRPRSDAGDRRREVDHVAAEEVGSGHVGDGAGQRSADGSTVEPLPAGPRPSSRARSAPAG